MRKINMSIHIERPIEEVFSALTDARSQPQWDSGMIEGRHEPDAPAQLGTRITEVRKFMGRVIETTSELIEFEANKKSVRKGKNGPMTLTGILIFTETGTGTHVEWTWLLELAGPLSLMTPIMATLLRKDGEAEFNNFKQVLENGEFKPLD